MTHGMTNWACGLCTRLHANAGGQGSHCTSSQPACVCVPVRRPLQHAQAVWGCPGQPAPWLQIAYPGLGNRSRHERRVPGSQQLGGLSTGEHGSKDWRVCLGVSRTCTCQWQGVPAACSPPGRACAGSGALSPAPRCGRSVKEQGEPCSSWQPIQESHSLQLGGRDGGRAGACRLLAERGHGCHTPLAV